MVLLVRVSVVALPTNVSVEVGNVRVPVFTIVPITGLVRVLLVSVSVVARPTNVSVDVGRVSVPVFTIVPITGLVRVLLVRVSVPAKVANVPAVGNDNEVLPLVVSVVLWAPLVVRFPPRVIVFPELLTPVPPYCPATTEPCQVPVPIVPTLVNDEPTIPDPSADADRTVAPLIS